MFDVTSEAYEWCNATPSLTVKKYFVLFVGLGGTYIHTLVKACDIYVRSINTLNFKLLLKSGANNVKRDVCIHTVVA